MIDIEIPGHRHLRLTQLAIDFNGTLAYDGFLLVGVKPQLLSLSTHLKIHVITGNTYGTATEALQGLPCEITLLDAEGQAQAKRQFVQELGADSTAAIGNGRNDAPMMGLAALSIGVLGPEGAAVEALAAADIVANSINVALGLLEQPKRLVATLRS